MRDVLTTRANIEQGQSVIQSVSQSVILVIDLLEWLCTKYQAKSGTQNFPGP